MLDDILRDILAGEVGRDVPIWVERRIADVGGKHRRRPLGLADHHHHRVDRLGAVVHVQPLLRGVDHDIALVARRQSPRPLHVELKQLALLVGRISLLGERLAELCVDRVHPAESADVFGQRRLPGGGEQSRERRGRRRPEVWIDVGDANPGILPQVRDIGNECGGQGLVGLKHVLALAGAGCVERLAELRDMIFRRIEAIEICGAEQ